ncbi:hypothetical protein FRC07_014519, partial [Ceratobasidium sp. 392]
MWPLNEQIAYIARDLKCPTGNGLLDCLRGVSGDVLRQSLLSTKTQFQPVVDNITVFKDAVHQTKLGKTAQIPLLIGTNKDEGTLIVEGEPTAYLNTTSPYVSSRNLNFPSANAAELSKYYPTPSDNYPTVYNSANTYRFMNRTVDTIVKSPPFVPATPEQRLISELLVTAWTNFVKDPFSGPQVSGWKRFNNADKKSLAIIGLSTSG